MKEWYTIVDDDSGRNYIIPYRFLDDWDAWICSESWSNGIVPRWADMIEGETLLFKEYKLKW